MPAKIRNIDTFILFKESQKKEMYEYLPLINGRDF